MSAPPPYLKGQDGAVLLLVRAQPGAKQTRLVGLHGERLKVALAAPPVDGKANAVLLAALADWLGLPNNRLALVHGATGRDKTVRVEAQLQHVAETLAALLADPK